MKLNLRRYILQGNLVFISAKIMRIPQRNCEITVARPAPTTPRPNEATRRRSSAIFSIFVMIKK